MSLKNFITSRVFLKHLILAIILVLLLIIITLQRLKSYTRHGESFPVPNFKGLTLNEIETVAKEHNLKFEIVDSMHVDGAEPGVVVEQVPVEGFKVKRNRIVFLSVNSTVPERVVLPKLTDISYRQATGLIENCGLVPGTISFEPSEYNNLVLRAEQNSAELKQGDIVEKGSSIDLVIGSSSGVQETPLPDLTGLNYVQADTLLKSRMLNKGVLICDETVLTSEDTLSALIWKQYPGTNVKFVSLGTSVDLWLTLDSLKLLKPVLKEPE